MEILRDPIYEEVAEQLKKLGVEAVLFDLDDTLIYTGEIFHQQMWKYSEIVSDIIGCDVNEVMMRLQEINDEEYKRMGVNPERWTAVVAQLARYFPGNEDLIREQLPILMEIYTIVPRMREGASALLTILRDLGIRIGLVTHANVSWTEFKLDQLGLWDYFDQVYVANENGHKKSIDWDQAAQGLGVEPENCVVVGDSLSGDIRPGSELGAKTVYMPSPWVVYRQGQVPEETKLIGNIFETLAALERLR